jgi:hypothetical protein
VTETKLETTITNEAGKSVRIVVTVGLPDVSVYMQGPNSILDAMVTRKEAGALLGLMLSAQASPPIFGEHPAPVGAEEQKRRLTLREALRLLLDQVDYTNGACGPTELVGAVLPRDVIALCREVAKGAA